MDDNLDASSKPSKSSYTLEKQHLETIILKLDRMEAEIDIVKSAVFNYTSQTKVIKDKIEDILQNPKITL